MNRRISPLAGLLSIAVLMTAAVGVQAERERRYPLRGEESETLYITSGPVLRKLSLAYPTLAADLYWIRAIQYYGGNKRRITSSSLGLVPPPALARDAGVEYPLLYPLLDLATTLDPRFNVAYRFGAVFLAEPFPNGPGRPDLAVALLEKGLRARPDRWEYMLDIGFVYYWYREDYRAAAEWFDKASRIPGSPWWLKSLAATTFAQGGDRRSSRQMWTAIRESADIDWLKQDAERRLMQLQALDDIDRLQPLVRQFLARTGQHTASWQELVRDRLVPGIMADPTGTPYDLDQDGTVQLSRRSPLFPLPAESTTAQRPGT
jgi:tetratricopeptide (TPR) repeat protein